MSDFYFRTADLDVGYNGKLYLHMTRKIERNAFEQAFLGKLSSLGIGFQLSLSNLA